MADKKLKILWQDGFVANFVLADNPVAEYYYRSIKHLQHLDLYFGPRENSYHPLLNDRARCVNDLIKMLAEFGVSSDITKLNDQQYLNHLHDIYFTRCNSNNNSAHYTQWMQVHDMIHVIEMHNQGRCHTNLKNLNFNYRNLAGPLYRKFCKEYFKYVEYSLVSGTAYLREQELGKNPLTYYRNNEPEDIMQICRISKPWVNLIPAMWLALENQSENTNYETEIQDFVQWFEPYRTEWTQHYDIPDWEPRHMTAQIPIGQVDQMDEIINRAQQNNCPIRIVL
jgi:hypothetical protein